MQINNEVRIRYEEGWKIIQNTSQFPKYYQHRMISYFPNYIYIYIDIFTHKKSNQTNRYQMQLAANIKAGI